MRRGRHRRLGHAPVTEVPCIGADPPTGALEAAPSKEVGEPAVAGEAVNEAVGAWSGVTAAETGPVPTAIAVPAVLVAVVIGVTLLVLELAT